MPWKPHQFCLEEDEVAEEEEEVAEEEGVPEEEEVAKEETLLNRQGIFIVTFTITPKFSFTKKWK